MAKLVSLKQHGALMKFIFLVPPFIGVQNTGDYNIHNIAIIKFHTTINTTESGSRPCKFRKRVYIEMKVHDNVKEWPVTLSAKVGSSNCLQFGMLSINWSDRKEINESIFTSEHSFEVDIIIKITKNPSTMSIKLHEDETLTDFHLCAEDGSVAFHKSSLAAHSDVFKTMLNGQWKETVEGQVELKGVTRQTIQHFKDFLYLGALPDDGLWPLLLFGTRYLVEHLKGECTMKVIQMITAENLDKHLEYAVENDMHEFTSTILELVPEHVFASAYAIKMKALMCKTNEE